MEDRPAREICLARKTAGRGNLSGRPVAANKPEAEHPAKPCPRQDSRQLQGRGCEPALARTHGSGTSVGNSVSAPSVSPRSSGLTHDDKKARPTASRRPRRSAAAAWKGMADRPYLSVTIAFIGIPRVTPVSVAQDGATDNRAQHGRSYPARRRGAGRAPAERRSKRARHTSRARRAGCNGATHRRKSPPSTTFVDGERRSAVRALARWTSHATRRRRKPSNAPGSTDSINLRRASAALDEKCLDGAWRRLELTRAAHLPRALRLRTSPDPQAGAPVLTLPRAHLLVLQRVPAFRSAPHRSTRRPSPPRAPVYATSPATSPHPRQPSGLAGDLRLLELGQPCDMTRYERLHCFQRLGSRAVIEEVRRSRRPAVVRNPTHSRR